mgnify:CR=1 FL=1
MATKIIHKKSSVANRVPLSTDLESGEIALNLEDQKIYSKQTDGTVVEMAPADDSSDKLPLAGGTLTGNVSSNSNFTTTGNIGVGTADGSLNGIHLKSFGTDVFMIENPSTGSNGSAFRMLTSLGKNYIQTGSSTSSSHAPLLITSMNGGTEYAKFENGETTITGDITVSGTVDGRNVENDGTKLDTIETSADVTDTTNVLAALPTLGNYELWYKTSSGVLEATNAITLMNYYTGSANLIPTGGTMPVQGDISVTGDLSGAGDFNVSTTGGDLFLSADSNDTDNFTRIQFAVDDSVEMVLDSEGRLVVGGTVAESKIHLRQDTANWSGGLKITDAATTKNARLYMLNDKFHIDAATAGQLSGLTFLTTGEIGVGNSSPSEKLDVTGNIAVSGTVDGRDIATNIPASLGTAGQVLTVNSGATAGEWADISSFELISENTDGTATAPSVTGDNSIAMGDGTTVSGDNALAFGDGATAAGNHSIALGRGASTTSAGYGIAIGQASDAGSHSVAIGDEATSTATDSIALGRSSSTGIYGNSAVLGKSVTATATNQVSIGSSSQDVRISETYTLPKVDGTADQVLKTNGSGTVTWEDAGGGQTFTQTEFTATADQTTFTVSYTAGYVDVYLNGVKLANSEFTATNGTSVVLGTGASVNDIIETVAWDTFEVANAITAGDSPSFGNITVSGTVDGRDIAQNIPSSLGTATQILAVNSGATATEWVDASGGGIGVSQSWSIESRLEDTSYQNTSGNPIMVTITGQGGNADGTVEISSNNSTWVTVGKVNNSNTVTTTFVVPDDYYYRVMNLSGNGTWAELR